MSGVLSTRLERLLPNGRGVWIPMDHGLSGYPEDGLDRLDSVVDSIIAGGADAIVCQKGVLTHQSNRTHWDGFVCHVSASTAHGGDHSQSKVKVCTASEAKSRGALGVSGQINLGDEQEPQMLIDMGILTAEAHEENMPVLGMVYPRGPNLVALPNDITGGVAHAARGLERERHDARELPAPVAPLVALGHVHVLAVAAGDRRLVQLDDTVA